MSNIKIARLPAILAASGYARSTLYLRIEQGLWTRPVRLGARAVGWPSYEADKLTAARIAGKFDTEIRQLVVDLEAARESFTRGGYE
jgi:prophage regulatory protein